MTADLKNPNSERLRLIREALEASLPLGMRIALPRDLDELAEDVLEAEGMTRSRPRRSCWATWPDPSGGRRATVFGRLTRRVRSRREIVLDLETKRSAQETPGGWSNPAGMGVSMVGCYHYRGRRLVAYRGDRKGDLVLLEAALRDADRVIGFNTARFDLPALSGALGAWVLELPTLDLLQEVQHALGHRLSLDHLAEVTLGRRKGGDGLQALEFYRRGQWRKLERYCLQDVRLTRDLYEFAKRRGFLWYVPRGKRRRRRFEVTV